MLKFLRKYKGPAVAVGGTLLMVAFLIPEVLKQFQGDPGKVIIAEVNGRGVPAREIGLSEAELAALKAFFEPLVVDVLKVKDGTHWFLLTQEATKAGLVGQASNGLAWLPELSEFAAQYVLNARMQQGDINAFQTSQDPAKRLELQREILDGLTKGRFQAAGTSQLTIDEFDLALAKAHAVLRLKMAFNQAARFSDLAAMNTVKRLGEEAVIEYVSIPAAKALAQIQEPTDAELAAHFAQYKDVKPGSGLFGFGYVLPPRFKLEWLKLDRAQIETAIKLDPIDVSKFYARNRDRYKGDFAAEKPNVERDLRDQKVDEIMADADRVVRTEVSRQVRRLESDGSYKKLPTDWETQRPKFETIAAAIVDAVNTTQKITIPLPTVTINGSEWLSAQQIAALPDIGSAQARVANRAERLPSLLLQTRQIAGDNELGLQTGVPYIESPITDSRRNRYYLTILDAKPEASASDLSEVRADVIRDVKLQKAYLKLLGDVNAQLALAATGGVKSVADLYNAQSPPTAADPALEPKIGQRVSLNGQLSPEIDTPEFKAAVLKAAAALDPHKPAKDQDNLARTLVVGLPTKHGVTVAQITELHPVTVEAYRQIVQRQAAMLQQEELNQVLQANQFKLEDPFSFEATKARLGFQSRRPEEKTKPAPKPST